MKNMTITVPDLGVESAEVATIYVKVGDSINADDNLILIESDKASVEVPSTATGTVSKILVAKGDKISQGDNILELNIAEEDNATKNTTTQDSKLQESKDSKNSKLEESTVKNANKDDSNTKPPPLQEANVADTEQQLSLPDLGVDKATISEWLVAEGEAVEAEQSLLMVESDKASVEVPSPSAGVLVKHLVKVGDSVSTGDSFALLKATGETAVAENLQIVEEQPEDVKQRSQPESKQGAIDSSKDSNTDSNADSDKVTAINTDTSNIYAGPAVRKLCRQLGVDISKVSGSAKHGRIVKEDVFEFVKSSVNTGSANTSNLNTGGKTGDATNPAYQLPPLPDMSNDKIWGKTHEQPLSRIQQVSIPQLCYNTLLPQVTQFDLADITETENLRNELKVGLKKEGVSLTILAFIVKVCAYALKQYPKFNSHLADDQTKLIIRDEVHIGIAVAIDDGLIVPVLRHADKKGLKQIAIELKELAQKARDKKLTVADFSGASFSISSQGNLGGTYFTPLVNVPQVAILGVSEASIQPRWHEEKQGFEPRLMLPLSLSYDHRVINGADAAIFTRYLATLLADIRKILV